MAIPPSARPGRNDPCPCGSGRKYKQCCLRQDDAVDAQYARVRQAEGRLVPKLAEFALERWGRPWFEEAVATFYEDTELPEALDERPEFDLVFLPWLVLNFVANPTRRDAHKELDGRTVAQFYRDHFASELSGLDASFLDAASARAYSFYQVVGTVPGRSIDLRDVLTGETATILERAGSRSVEPGALVYALVVTVEGVCLQLGMAPEQIPPDWHPWLIDFRDRFIAKRLLRPAELMRHEPDLRRFYLEVAERIRNPRPPTVLNTDDELVVPTTLTFELRCSPERAFDRLKDLAFGHDPEDLLAGATRAEDGTVRSVEFPWAKAGNRKHKTWENTILGHLTIAPGQLTAFVNSTQRANRFRREVTKRLKADAVFAGATEESIEAAMAKAGAEGAPGGRRGRDEEPPDAADLEPPESPEVREMLCQMHARHMEAWLDEKVPALGNRTPRQAAKTVAGRERLEALLTSFEWWNRRAPEHGRADTADLRRKLGL